MSSHRSDRESGKPRVRESVTAIALAALIGSIIDWLIVWSQFSQRGDASPFLPPFSLTMLVIGTVVSIPAIALAGRVGSRPIFAAGVAIVGMLLMFALALGVGKLLGSADIMVTLIWFAPIALVAIPATTWIGFRTGHAWHRYAIVTITLVVLGTMLMMWFGLPRV